MSDAARSGRALDAMTCMELEDYVAREQPAARTTIPPCRRPPAARSSRRRLAPAQDVLVAPAAGDLRRVEVLEQRLGELARGAELVAQPGERDRALGLDEAATRRSHLRERLGVGVQGRARPAPRGRRRAGRAARPRRRRARPRSGGSWPGGAQPLLEGERGGGQRGRRASSRRRRRGVDRVSAAAGSRLAAAQPLEPGRRARRGTVACGRAASSTTPPPSVSGGAIRRTTSAVAGAATSGRSRRSCQKRAAERGQPRGRLARAVVDLDARAVLGASRSVERGVEAVGRRAARCSGSARTSPRATSRDARRPTRLSATRWPAAARSTGASWTWTPRTRARAAREQARATSPRPTEPDHSVPVTTVPAPRDRERAVDVQAHRGAAPAAARQAGGERGRARRAARRGPRPCGPSTATTSTSPSSSRASAAATRGSARSAFVIATTPSVDPERRRAPRRARASGASRRRRRRRPSGRGRCRSRRRPSCARSARGPGTSTTDRRAPRGQLERRVAELDRDAARPLLRQPVGVDAGERTRSAPSCRGRCGRRCRASAGAGPRLGRSSERGEPHDRAPAASASSSAERARVEQQRGRRCDRARRPAGRRARSRRRAQRVGAGRPGVERDRRARAARAAAARRRRPARSSATTSAPRSGRARRARAARRAPRAPPRRRRASRAPGSRAARARGRGRGAASPRARRASSLSIRTRARERVARGSARSASRPADEQPGLRPAEQLVAGEADERRAGAHRAAHRRLVGAARRGRSASAPEPTSSITGAPERAQRLDLDLLDEADRAEVRRVRAQDRAGVARRSPRS